LRSVVAAAKKGKGGKGFSGVVYEKEQKEEEEAERLPNKQDVPADMWEDDKFDFLGNLATYAGVFIAALAIMVGFFASGQYNEGAVPVDFQAADSPAVAVKIAFENQGKGDL